MYEAEFLQTKSLTDKFLSKTAIFTRGAINFTGRNDGSNLERKWTTFSDSPQVSTTNHKEGKPKFSQLDFQSCIAKAAETTVTSVNIRNTTFH